jgi:hypothetical protein
MLALDVYGGKHMECDPKCHKLKCRIVLHGGQELDAHTGFKVDFQAPPGDIQAASGIEVRTALAIAKVRGHCVAMGDVEAAYLNTESSGNCWARLPRWLNVHLFGPEVTKVLDEGDALNKVNISIYGRKASGFDWDAMFARKLGSRGFERDDMWSSVWRRGDVMLVVYVDDVLIVAPSEKDCMDVGAEVREVVPLGQLSMLGAHTEDPFVGVTYRFEEGLYACDQVNYAKVLCARFDDDCTKYQYKKSLRGFELPVVEADEECEHAEESGKLAAVAARHIGGLLYLVRHSRPDTMYGVGRLARKTSRWQARDDKGLERLFGYLFATVDFVLVNHVVEGDLLRLVTLVDADFAGCRDSRRSTTCFLVYLVGDKGSRVLIAWHSALQKSISLSTCEAEYKALVECGRQTLAVIPLLEFVDGSRPWMDEFAVLGDAQACIDVCKSGASKKLRYLRKGAGIAFGWAREHLADHLSKLASALNTSDIGTKVIEAASFLLHRGGLGVVSFQG